MSLGVQISFQYLLDKKKFEIIFILSFPTTFEFYFSFLRCLVYYGNNKVLLFCSKYKIAPK